MMLHLHIKYQSKKGGKDQESIQSSTTPDPGYHLGSRPKKTPAPAVKFLDLIFRNNFLSLISAICVRDESCRGEFPPTSPKGLVLVP